MKEQKKEEQKKKRRFVYGIHDLLFLPLILGMAFVDEEKEQQSLRTRKEVKDYFEDELDVIEEQLDHLAADHGSNHAIEHKEEHSSKAVLASPSIKEEVAIHFQDLDLDLEEIEQQLIALTLDDYQDEPEKVEEAPENTEDLIEVPESVLEEYQEWAFTELPYERFYDLKEKEMEVQVDVQKHPEVPPIDLSDYRDQEHLLQENLNEVTDLLNRQKKDLEEMKKKLNTATSLERTKIKFNTSSQLFTSSLIAYYALAHSSLNPVYKFALQAVLLNRAFRVSKQVITEKVDLPIVDYSKQIYAMLQDSKNMHSMLNGTIYQAQSMRRAFILEFKDLKDYVDEYDSTLKKLDQFISEIKEEQKKVDGLTEEVQRQLEKNNQRQKRLT